MKFVYRRLDRQSIGRPETHRISLTCGDGQREQHFGADSQEPGTSTTTGKVLCSLALTAENTDVAEGNRRGSAAVMLCNFSMCVCWFLWLQCFTQCCANECGDKFWQVSRARQDFNTPDAPELKRRGIAATRPDQASR